MTESPAPGHWPGQETNAAADYPSGENPQEDLSGPTARWHTPGNDDSGPGGGPIPDELDNNGALPPYIHAVDMTAASAPWSPPASHPPRHYLPDEPATLPRAHRGGLHPGRRHQWWPLAACAAVIAGALTAAAVLANGGTPAGQSRTAGKASADRPVTTQGAGASIGREQPVITRAAAQRVLTAYTAANNQANMLREDGLLGTIETDSSYQMDTGGYRFLRASDPAGHDYAPMELTDPAFYIPREAASVFPHWFVAEVTYVYPQNPGNTSGPGYVLFTQASPDAAWKDALEPNILTGSNPLPRIAADGQGYAEQASMASGSPGLSVAPGRLAAVTASALDGSAAAKITVPDNLQEQKDQAFWRSRLPQGSTDTDAHRQAADAVYGLRTADGGALLFYAVSAQLTLAPPDGQSFQVDIPGYYSPTGTRTSAVVGYIDQFATYNPPRGGSPRIIADTSGIASRG